MRDVRTVTQSHAILYAVAALDPRCFKPALMHHAWEEVNSSRAAGGGLDRWRLEAGGWSVDVLVG